MVEGVCEADGLVVGVPGAEPPRHVVHVVTRQEPVLQYGTIGFNILVRGFSVIVKTDGSLQL